MKESDNIVIIGGGIGGLFTGALLAKEGCPVTVLEKNATIGGGLQTFIRDGIEFETGMHILGGLRHGGSIHKICTWLGILDKISLLDHDHDCIDQITYLSDGKTYRIPEGRKRFVEYFSSLFPSQASGLREYVDTLYRLADEVDLFYLRPSTEQFKEHSDLFTTPAGELLSRFITDSKLRDILAYMNPMAGGLEHLMPAYIFALINVLYINGPSRFAGGSLQMALALKDVIEEWGGQVLSGKEVTGIEVNEENAVSAAVTADGNRYPAATVVSAIHPARMVDLLPSGALPKVYRRRLQSLPNTVSAFIVYIKFKPGTFPYINHTCYCQDDYGLVWKHYDYDSAHWPQGFMYMTPADRNQGPYATKMIINCLMPFTEVEQWSDTLVGRRGDAYLRWKEEHQQRVLDRMEQLVPGFSGMVEKVWSSSPLTIRDFYNQPDGALYGIRRDCDNMMATQIPMWTKVRNLLLTGQNINLHGICGVPLTSLQTAEAVLGRQNYILEKINNYYTQLYGKN